MQLAIHLDDYGFIVCGDQSRRGQNEVNMAYFFAKVEREDFKLCASHVNYQKNSKGSAVSPSVVVLCRFAADFPESKVDAAERTIELLLRVQVGLQSIRVMTSSP